MVDTPLVSIAIITYNQKEFLRECIDSCLAQDYPNTEIVVADDGSTDGTQEMLREYCQRYPNKFVLCLAEKNHGITKNSNAAHFVCKGKYIAWMGGDDLMLPSKLKSQVEFMESNPKSAICYHNVDVFDTDTGQTLYLFNEFKKINGDIRDSISYGTFNCACSTMVRTDNAPKEGFNVSLPVASDWLYWVRTLESGGTIDYIDKVLGRYRRHKSNITLAKPDKLTQVEIDTLNSCNIMLAAYPHLSSHVLWRYGDLLLSFRNKLKYDSALIASFACRPRIKTLIRLSLYYISFKRLCL